MLMGTSLPVNTLVKVKEGLLRQRELEIDRYTNISSLYVNTRAHTCMCSCGFIGFKLTTGNYVLSSVCKTTYVETYLKFDPNNMFV